MDVWITLANDITLDGETDRITLEARGTAQTVQETVALRYDEVDADGAVTHAEVILFPDRVRIRRAGDICSEMTLIPQGRGALTVTAAGGMMRLDTELTRYTVGEQADGTRIWKMEYNLYAGPGAPATHRMTVTARPL